MGFIDKFKNSGGCIEHIINAFEGIKNLIPHREKKNYNEPSDLNRETMAKILNSSNIGARFIAFLFVFFPTLLGMLNSLREVRRYPGKAAYSPADFAQATFIAKCCGETTARGYNTGSVNFRYEAVGSVISRCQS